MTSKERLCKAAAIAAAISLIAGFGYGMAGTAIAHNLRSGSNSSSNPGQPGSMGGEADTMNFDYSDTYSGALTANGEEMKSDEETIEATNSDQNTALSVDLIDRSDFDNQFGTSTNWSM